MKKYKYVSIICVVMLCFTMILEVRAADILCRLTHNDQDLLAVVDVTNVSNNVVKATVVKKVRSAKNLNESDIRKEVDAKDVKFNIEKTDKELEIKPGDKLLVSLDKEITGFSISNGIYKLSEREENIYNVEAKEKREDEIIIETFLNSDGKICDFTIEQSKEDDARDLFHVEITGENSAIIYVGYEDSLNYKDIKINNENKDIEGYDIMGVPINNEIKPLVNKNELIVTASVTLVIFIIIILVKYIRNKND